VTVSELPRIAVVTPSFNTARYIGAAIRSVLDQDYPNLDYLVMDGDSTDDTLDVLRSFGDRIRWVSEKDQGQADAIRRGFEQTTGDILAWLNSDDLFNPGAFRAIAAFFDSHPQVDVVYGDASYVDTAGKHIARCAHIEPFSRRRLLHYSDFIVQPAAFFRRSAYDAVGGINPRWHWAMDYDLWIRMAQKHRFAYISRELACYRWLKGNKTATGGFGRVDEIREMARTHGLRPPAYVELERVNLYAGRAVKSLRQGKFAKAIPCATLGAATLLASPRAILSLFSPRTWRIIWVGQVLRRRGVGKHPAKAWEGAPCASQT
jgi:glycosyltransferase involved in cell wall biosynthesis